MSHQKPPRNKKYTPGRTMQFGGLDLIARRLAAEEDQRAIPDEDRTDLNCAYWLAMHQMVFGHATEESWSVIVCSLNVALVLCERGLGKDYEPYLVKALDGAFRAKVRADLHDAWRFDGDAITDIRQALQIHDEQVVLATKQQMRDALTEVHRRITNGNVYQAVAA